MGKALVSVISSLRRIQGGLHRHLFEKSMAGMGTRENKLIRPNVRHRDPHVMAMIKEAASTAAGGTLYARMGEG
ncbi:uncharacterized protein EV422DRAFT_568816 [Fimicolochytrium jonesii]|uniref:uncharacterized protein n=1 Tax=Fimicolochytrium jonesii TaxID=1396493 RepID=UPI0022FE95AD|nr:uncharacterized protein EV422DRAFT_568816 [Fimicolochytrium jonesii]KAI8819384.1 hypothetical protein EV422DRAFT_568816 [Fimicolochytrium jonesii]